MRWQPIDVDRVIERARQASERAYRGYIVGVLALVDSDNPNEPTGYVQVLAPTVPALTRTRRYGPGRTAFTVIAFRHGRQVYKSPE